MTTTIKSMKKVTFTVLEETVAKTGQANSPAQLEMIFGIGTQGLSAFELALEGKRVGEMMRYKVFSSQADEFFGQFFPAIRLQLGLQILPAEMCFLIEIKDIRDAENKEIVKALAASGGHGCGGGSCDCGCG